MRTQRRQPAEPLPTKELTILHGEIKTPPLSEMARVEVGQLLRKVQNGELLAAPQSRPMPSIGARIHELRVNDEDQTWRVIYRIDEEEVVVAEVFSKKTPQTPLLIINACKRRFKFYDG